MYFFSVMTEILILGFAKELLLLGVCIIFTMFTHFISDILIVHSFLLFFSPRRLHASSLILCGYFILLFYFNFFNLILFLFFFFSFPQLKPITLAVYARVLLYLPVFFAKAGGIASYRATQVPFPQCNGSVIVTTQGLAHLLINI